MSEAYNTSTEALQDDHFDPELEACTLEDVGEPRRETMWNLDQLPVMKQKGGRKGKKGARGARTPTPPPPTTTVQPAIAKTPSSNSTQTDMLLSSQRKQLQDEFDVANADELPSTIVPKMLSSFLDRKAAALKEATPTGAEVPRKRKKTSAEDMVEDCWASIGSFCCGPTLMHLAGTCQWLRVILDTLLIDEMTQRLMWQRTINAKCVYKGVPGTTEERLVVEHRILSNFSYYSGKNERVKAEEVVDQAAKAVRHPQMTKAQALNNPKMPAKQLVHIEDKARRFEQQLAEGTRQLSIKTSVARTAMTFPWSPYWSTQLEALETRASALTTLKGDLLEDRRRLQRYTTDPRRLNIVVYRLDNVAKRLHRFDTQRILIRANAWLDLYLTADTHEISEWARIQANYTAGMSCVALDLLDTHMDSIENTMKEVWEVEEEKECKQLSGRDGTRGNKPATATANCNPYQFPTSTVELHQLRSDIRCASLSNQEDKEHDVTQHNVTLAALKGPDYNFERWDDLSKKKKKAMWWSRFTEKRERMREERKKLIDAGNNVFVLKPSTKL